MSMDKLVLSIKKLIKIGNNRFIPVFTSFTGFPVSPKIQSMFSLLINPDEFQKIN